MIKNTELSVVILNYNTRERLNNCLRSLFKFLPEKSEVIVVDNASSDGSKEMVARSYPKVTLIKNKNNLGFAAGNNVALKNIRSKFVLLLNPDTEIVDDSIGKVMDYMKNNPNVGAATCRVELPDGKLDYSCHRGFPTPWNSLAYFSGLSRLFPKSKFFSGYTMTFHDMDKVHEIDSLTGAFAMIRTRAGKQVDWLDEDYFWNGEDLDLCYKLKLKGWKILYLPETKVIHYKGSASGLKKTGLGRVDRVIKKRSALSSTNVMRIFYKKHLSKRYHPLLNWVVNLGINFMEAFRIARSSI